MEKGDSVVQNIVRNQFGPFGMFKCSPFQQALHIIP
jgi:hypothetical protein